MQNSKCKPRTWLLVTTAVLGAPLLLAVAIAAQPGAAPRPGSGQATGEWRRTGGDAGSTRYSPLDQITAQHVRELRVAWTWRGGNYRRGAERKSETTPIMVGGVLYFTAGDRRSVVAADAGSG